MGQAAWELEFRLGHGGIPQPSRRARSLSLGDVERLVRPSAVHLATLQFLLTAVTDLQNR